MQQPYQIHLSHRGLPFWCNTLLRFPQSGFQNLLFYHPELPFTRLNPTLEQLDYRCFNISLKVAISVDVRAVMATATDIVLKAQAGGARSRTKRTLFFGFGNDDVDGVVARFGLSNPLLKKKQESKKIWQLTRELAFTKVNYLHIGIIIGLFCCCTIWQPKMLLMNVFIVSSIIKTILTGFQRTLILNFFSLCKINLAAFQIWMLQQVLSFFGRLWFCLDKTCCSLRFWMQ